MAGALYTDATRSVVQALREARLETGLHQAQLAKRVGKDQTFISNVERGQRRIDVIELYAIARAMELDPVELYRRLIEHLPDRVDDLIA